MKYILIKLPNWLGDTMMLTPTIAYMRRLFPQIKIILVGNSLSVSLFCINKTFIKTFIDNSKQKKGIINRITNTIRLAGEINSYLHENNIELDCAITAQNNFFSAFLLSKIAVKKRIGYGDKNAFGMRKFLLTHIVKYKSGRPPFCTHQVLNYMCLLLPILPHSFFKASMLDSKHTKYNPLASRVQNLLYNEAKNLELYLPIIEKKSKKKIIAICTSASYGDSKMWLISHFATIIIDFIQKGYVVRIYGAKNDIERNEQIEKSVYGTLKNNNCNKLENLSGKTSIQELINSLNECRLYIGNDSGITHIARALNIPSIIIFGPMPFSWCSPWSVLNVEKRGEYYIAENTISIQKNIPCVPCKQKTCPLKHHDCMRLITPEEVLKLVYETLSI